MQFLLTKTILVFIVPVGFSKSLVNKMPLFWSTEFCLLTNRFLTTQNHWKPFKTIKRKKADFSALSKLLKNVEKGWKSARLERVARIELAQPGRKHGILPLNYTRIYIINYTQINYIFQYLKIIKAFKSPSNHLQLLIISYNFFCIRTISN